MILGALFGGLTKLLGGALGGGGGGGILGSLGGIAQQLLPGIMGQTARQSPVDRSILDLRSKRYETDAARQSAMMMKDARQSISTARALMSSSGFAPMTGSLAEVVPQESMLNLASALSSIESKTAMLKAEGEMESKLMEMQQSQQQSPMGSQLFSTVLQPLMSKGLSSLGGLLGSFGK